MSKRILAALSTQRLFLLTVVVLALLCWFAHPYRFVAMWLTFILAAYSAISNDSIQTLGTFIYSNQNRKWYYLWFYMGGIFVLTTLFSWWVYDGDVSHQRLTIQGLDQPPETFTFLMVFSPVVLLFLTRMRMPVSTSFLLLGSFTTSHDALEKILQKSFLGYGLAFLCGILLWWLISARVEKGKAARFWVPLQWISSGFLWSAWISQDMANIAIVLPRRLDLGSLVFILLFIFAGLGILFYRKGGRIQKVVSSKTNVHLVRSATIINLAYALILFYLKWVSHIPISTTWVFLGLLAGREFGISLSARRALGNGAGGLGRSFFLMRRDLLLATIGLIVSLILAFLINR